MVKPIILTIDDELQVLKAIERDLRDKYINEYRIIKANSGIEGIEIVRKLKQRGEEVALFLVDHKMPVMNGTEFLINAVPFYPESKRYC